MSRAPTAKPPLASRLLKWSRKIHLWAGVALALLLLIEGVTGFVLIHKNDWYVLREARLSTEWLPARYGEGAAREARRVEALAIDGEDLLAGTKLAVLRRRDGSWQRPPIGLVLGHVRAIAIDGERRWIGHRDGLARCDAELARCTDVTPEALADPEARAILVAEDAIYVAFHRDGVFRTQDAGATLARVGEPIGGARGAASPTKERATGRLREAAASCSSRPTGASTRSPAPAGARSGPRATRSNRSQRAPGASGSRPGGSQPYLWNRQGGAWHELELMEAAPRDLDGLAHADERGPVRLAMAGAEVLVASERGVRRLDGTGQATRLVETDERARALAVGHERWAAAVGETVIVGSGDSATAIALPSPPAAAIPVERLINDLHTGKLFDGRLTLVYDATALSIGLFVATGLHLWLTPIWLRRRKKR